MATRPNQITPISGPTIEDILPPELQTISQFKAKRKAVTGSSLQNYFLHLMWLSLMNLAILFFIILGLPDSWLPLVPLPTLYMFQLPRFILIPSIPKRPCYYQYLSLGLFSILLAVLAIGKNVTFIFGIVGIRIFVETTTLAKSTIAYDGECAWRFIIGIWKCLRDATLVAAFITPQRITWPILALSGVLGAAASLGCILAIVQAGDRLLYTKGEWRDIFTIALTSANVGCLSLYIGAVYYISQDALENNNITYYILLLVGGAQTVIVILGVVAYVGRRSVM